MRIKEYNREEAVAYAKKWAYARNPAYYNFDPLGGDCTNFISQCIYAGSGVMNYNHITGWYYRNANDRSPSWSGVEFLYQFMTRNNNVGPFGKESNSDEVETGDFIQLSFDGIKFSHSLLIVKKHENNVNEILVATHTNDSLNRIITTYQYQKIRFMHIEGVKNW